MAAPNDPDKVKKLLAEEARADEIAANRKRTRYPAARVLALAEEAANLGMVCHIDGFPFGKDHQP